MSEQRRERKVVTVLFADLVGFTARAEALDPEDVEAILRPYHERLRSELERFGGTVEKFIGDAVMALFGAPVAHEDDPERAVRAALEIRDWARDDDDVHVRIAVNTGEALVNLEARPASGEGMATGDVVNTTARLQSAAPVNGILVGETTYRATRDVIDYDDADAVEAKGKSAPIRVWEAIAARSRVSTEAVSAHAPMFGRERELEQVVGALERAMSEQASQLVTIVGVPGIGKSRLVAELLEDVNARPDFVHWRHGRSLPYGDGVTFWALGEIVKAQAGILETDTADEIERKVHETVVDLVGESEVAWVESNVRPLVGLHAQDVGRERRDESFAAWRRLLEALADRHPTVLVFEDLHWAGDELLDFVDSLPDWIEDVPMLVLCTARPELLDRRPSWGGGKRNALTISLSPLEPADTARLIAALLDRSVLPAETQGELLARAGGNPLYAEQFVRMLEERGENGAAVAIPETVQGIIAARLDALPPAEKVVLQHAAVFGRSFWLGSLAAMNDAEGDTLEQCLRALARKDFIRRERRSAAAGETQHTFTHVLVRDVAYGQVPRAQRARLHERAARWIESLGREDDHGELLAHHYLNALELLRLMNQDVSGLIAPATRAFRAAADRARALNAHSLAVGYFEQALQLMSNADPERPRTLLHYAQTLHFSRDERRFDALEEARGALLANGDFDGAAAADVSLAESAWWRGDGSATAFVDRATDEVRSTSDINETKALALSHIARFRSLFGTSDRGLAEHALEMAEAVGRSDLQARNLITLGTDRFYVGEYGVAITELERGIEIAERAGAFFDVSRGYSNLGTVVERIGDLGRAAMYAQKALDVAERIGIVEMIRFGRANAATLLLHAGEWVEAVARARAFLAESASSPHYMDVHAFLTLARVHFARNEVDEAIVALEEAIVRAQAINDPQVNGPTFGVAAWVRAELGDRDSAVEALRAIADPVSAQVEAYFAAAAVGDVAGFADALDDNQAEMRWDRAHRAVLEHRWKDAADAFEEIGTRPFEALARLRVATVARDAGNRADANLQINRSLAFWRSVGATRYIREAEALLAKTA